MFRHNPMKQFEIKMEKVVSLELANTCYDLGY